jgi:hypothetical protein
VGQVGRVQCCFRSSVMEARRVVSTSHEVLVRLSAFSRVSRCWCSPSGWPPRRRLAFALRERWGGNLGLAAVDTLVLRTVPWITAVGVAALANARGLGASRGHRVSADLVGCRPLGRSRWISRFTSSTRLFHAVPALWRLHRVHHTDPELDVTTGLRFHSVGDAALRGFKAEWSRHSGHRSWRSSCSRSCSMPARCSATPTCGSRPPPIACYARARHARHASRASLR